MMQIFIYLFITEFLFCLGNRLGSSLYQRNREGTREMVPSFLCDLSFNAKD